jgi:hypothetical protein
MAQPFTAMVGLRQTGKGMKHGHRSYEMGCRHASLTQRAGDAGRGCGFGRYVGLCHQGVGTTRADRHCHYPRTGVPARVNPNVTALCPSQIAQPLCQSGKEPLGQRLGLGKLYQHPDAPHPLALLRACRHRPRRRASEQRDEIATFHCLMPPVLSTRKDSTPRMSRLVVIPGAVAPYESICRIAVAPPIVAARGG